MTIQWRDVRILLPTLILVAGACAADGGSPTSGPAPSPSGDTSGIAAGSVEDTLQACLARIPGDATAGQRMVAEQSCAQEQARRK